MQWLYISETQMSHPKMFEPSKLDLMTELHFIGG